MTAELFLGASLGAFLVSLVWLWFYIRHACDDLAMPDVHGDYPAIPPEVIERARLAAVLEDRERDQMREQS